MYLRETSSFPKTEDLHGAAIALVRLQDTYQLNVTELADGHFQGVDHSKEKGKKLHNIWIILMPVVKKEKEAREEMRKKVAAATTVTKTNPKKKELTEDLWFLFQVFQSKRDLTGRDCLFLAQHAFAEHYYDTALQWAHGALDAFARKGQHFGPDVHIFREEVHNFIQHASRVVKILIFNP